MEECSGTMEADAGERREWHGLARCPEGTAAAVEMRCVSGWRGVGGGGLLGAPGVHVCVERG